MCVLNGVTEAFGGYDNALRPLAKFKRRRERSGKRPTASISPRQTCGEGWAIADADYR